MPKKYISKINSNAKTAFIQNIPYQRQSDFAVPPQAPKGYDPFISRARKQENPIKK